MGVGDSWRLQQLFCLAAHHILPQLLEILVSFYGFAQFLHWNTCFYFMHNVRYLLGVLYSWVVNLQGSFLGWITESPERLIGLWCQVLIIVCRCWYFGAGDSAHLLQILVTAPDWACLLDKRSLKHFLYFPLLWEDVEVLAEFVSELKHCQCSYWSIYGIKNELQLQVYNWVDMINVRLYHVQLICPIYM